ncbi:hypothetical protein [Halomonas alimentaria]|uniref:hypothetical protein n=1 Tax=Halomonas alimentaria TaxID=147248 RepID=UPI0024932468|nr:hypothetical protein [Halomonas alimentaria]
MLQRLKHLYHLLNAEQEKKPLGLQVLVILMAFAQAGGVAAIGPFMAVEEDISRLEGEGVLAQLFQASGLATPRQFLLGLGIGALVVLTGKALLSMFVSWRLALHAQQIGVELPIRLYHHYRQQPCLSHASGSSTELPNQITQERGRLTNSIINPHMQMNGKVVIALLMTIAGFFYNPLVALSGLAIFSAAYMLIYRADRRLLIHNGKAIIEAQRLYLKLMEKGFDGIKDALLIVWQAKKDLVAMCEDAWRWQCVNIVTTRRQAAAARHE